MVPFQIVISCNPSAIKQVDKTNQEETQNSFAIFSYIQQTNKTIKMNKQIVIFIALCAMVACAFAQYDYGQQYHTEEKKFISLPALKLKLGTDKLTFKLPNLMTLFQQHQEHHYPQHY